MTFRRLLQGMMFLALGVLVAPSWSEAQDQPRMTEPEAQTEEHPDSSRHFEAKKRERLIQMLQLDDTTRANLLQRLEQLDQKADQLRRQRREAFLALRDQAKNFKGKGDRKSRDAEKAPAAGAPIDAAALKAALDRVYAVEDAMSGLRRERLQIVRDVLTPEQQVRFLIYSIKFHKEMRERLEREQGTREKP